MTAKLAVIDSISMFESRLDTEKTFRKIAFQSVDFTPLGDRLSTIEFEECLFLGCRLPNQLGCRLIDNNNLVFPDITGLPFQPFRNNLYDRHTLFKGFDPATPVSYQETPDNRIYQYWLDTGRFSPGSIRDSLARRLHDHSITDALHDFIAQWGSKDRLVAIMGGHSLARDSEDYRKAAHIARELTRQNYLMLSGGGPGAMEATHLGACFAAYSEKDLLKAIGILSEAPVFRDTRWLSKAFEVIERFKLNDPQKNPYSSVGIPTWHYGHEPPTPFASHIAKYFDNSVREEGLLAVARGGVIFTPGGPGTIQEIFQEACQNHYNSYGNISPMQ